MVEAVQPRRSVLLAPDPFYTHLRQVIVANVDQVLDRGCLARTGVLARVGRTAT